jgi:hypothetical protein
VIKLDLMGINIVIMPLLYSLVLAVAFYLAKPIKWISEDQSRVSGEIMMLVIGPLLAKLAIASGQSIMMLFNVGPALILHELGNLGTIFLALPAALLLGFKREAIGMTSSICREPQMAVVIDKYGFGTPETNGFFTVFLIGTVLGAAFISILVSVMIYVLPLHPYAYAIACGIGSASMNAAAITSLVNIYPGMTQQLEAFSGMSNLIAMCVGIYVYIFIAIPMTEWMYSKLEPRISKYLFKRNQRNIKDQNNGK